MSSDKVISIVGMQHNITPEKLADLLVLDEDWVISNLSFKREPDNEYDAKAIAVFLEGAKIGYVSKLSRPTFNANIDYTVDFEILARGATAIQLKMVVDYS